MSRFFQAISPFSSKDDNIVNAIKNGDIVTLNKLTKKQSDQDALYVVDKKQDVKLTIPYLAAYFGQREVFTTAIQWPCFVNNKSEIMQQSIAIAKERGHVSLARSLFEFTVRVTPTIIHGDNSYEYSPFLTLPKYYKHDTQKVAVYDAKVMAEMNKDNPDINALIALSQLSTFNPYKLFNISADPNHREAYALPCLAARFGHERLFFDIFTHWYYDNHSVTDYVTIYKKSAAIAEENGHEHLAYLIKADLSKLENTLTKNESGAAMDIMALSENDQQYVNSYSNYIDQTTTIIKEEKPADFTANPMKAKSKTPPSQEKKEESPNIIREELRNRVNVKKQERELLQQKQNSVSAIKNTIRDKVKILKDLREKSQIEKHAIEAKEENAYAQLDKKFAHSNAQIVNQSTNVKDRDDYASYQDQKLVRSDETLRQISQNIQATLSQHFLVNEALQIGFDIASLQGKPILTLEQKSTYLIKDMAKYIESQPVQNMSQKYENFSKLGTKEKIEDIFRTIAIGIVLTDRDRIHEVSQGNLKGLSPEISSALLSIEGNEEALSTKYSNYLAMSAVGNILNGKLEQNHLGESHAKAQAKTHIMDLKNMTQNIIRHSTNTDKVATANAIHALRTPNTSARKAVGQTIKTEEIEISL